MRDILVSIHPIQPFDNQNNVPLNHTLYNSSQFKNPPLLKITYIGSSSESQTKKKNYSLRVISRVCDSFLSPDIYQRNFDDISHSIHLKSGDVYALQCVSHPRIFFLFIFHKMLCIKLVCWTYIQSNTNV